MYEYKAKIVKVIDGDTFDALIDLGFEISVKKRIRLLWVDAPEIKGEDREFGLKVKEIITKDLLNKDVTIKTKKASQTDTYGRWLAAIYLEDGICYNNYLIENNLVKSNSKWNIGVKEDF